MTLKIAGVARAALSLALLGALAGCGNGANEAAPAATEPVVAGLVPTVRNDLPRPQANGQARCNIEQAQKQGFEQGRPQIARNATVDVVGWYVDPAANTAGQGLQLVIHDGALAHQWSVPLESRTARRDVAAASDGGDALANTGFRIGLNLSGLPAGNYGFYLIDSRAQAGACGIGRVFVLR